MAELVDVRTWVDRHRRRLMAGGVRFLDAQVSARLAWEILRMHRVCFGDTIPLVFDQKPEGFFREALASCHGGFFEGAMEYRVYPHSLFERVSDLWHIYGSRVPFGRVLQAIAMHEMRHRVQDRERDTLVTFARDRYHIIIGDSRVFVTAWKVHREFTKEEEGLRLVNADEKYIEWRLGPIEYDAVVIERLFLSCADELQNDTLLAMFVRKHAP